MIELLAAEGVAQESVRVSWNLYSWLCEKMGASGGLATALLIAAYALCAIVPYLLGSINPAIIFSRFFYHEDIRQYGSGNAGTTNTLRTYGKKMAALIFACDLFKAAIAVAFGSLMLSMSLGGAVAGFFAILGHAFPIYYKFKGGKGVACTAVVVLMLSPISFVILISIFAIILAFTKYVSLASVMGVALYPIIASAFTRSSPDKGGLIPAFACFTAALVIFMHRENIKRLYHGTESKISFKKTDKHKAGEASGELTDSEKSEDEPKKAEKVYTDDDFVKCAGCGQTIPKSRQKCVYCGEVNKAYVPKPSDTETGKKKKKK